MPFVSSIRGNYKKTESTGSRFKVTGGDSIMTAGGYRIHTFLKDGDSELNIEFLAHNQPAEIRQLVSSLSVEYLVVGAGGGGGGGGGGTAASPFGAVGFSSGGGGAGVLSFSPLAPLGAGGFGGLRGFFGFGGVGGSVGGAAFFGLSRATESARLISTRRAGVAVPSSIASAQACRDSSLSASHLRTFAGRRSSHAALAASMESG
jgi:hypothetical protein